MSLVNSLAIGDAYPSTLVKGRDQTPVSSTVQNKKLFINLKSFDNAGGQLTRLFRGRVRHAVVGFEWVFFGMGEEDGGRKLTDARSEPLHRPSIQFRVETISSAMGDRRPSRRSDRDEVTP